AVVPAAAQVSDRAATTAAFHPARTRGGSMQIGAVLSQNELGGDLGGLRAYAQAVQDLGYDFLVAADHVVGTEAAAHPELERVFPIESVVHEPFSLLSYLAAVAPRLGFVTSVIILPQRQTVLVAKQAAELDLLTNGRFRLGVGIGWNPVEFEALGIPFNDRARRFEEQIEVMRRLWTERVVTFEGKYHTLRAAGINPRPVQQPIPIWIGASAEVAVRRATRIADGFLPLAPLDGGWQATIDKLHGWLEQAGRAPASFGLEGRLDASRGTPDDWRKAVEMWQGFGASHLSVTTGRLGAPDAHLQRLREVRQMVAS
ncbi:MAG TPA: LLM class F420-dependent oxidoreductase, partial [Chloroflexota bacterium]|nr:LLM class F420-dependent oxidoreductase [Chloroflexota bacterium]